MKPNPLVSVVMPFYNTPASFLKEAIESVLNQQYDNWELLLVDDGSPNDCSNFAKEIAEDHSQKIHYFEHANHKNLGASLSRQLAIDESKGDLIAFLDADDIWLPNKLKDQVPTLISNKNAGLLYGNTLYWYSWTGINRDKKLDFMPVLGITPNALIQPPVLVSLFLNGKAAVPCMCSIIIRKDVLDSVGGFESSFHVMYDDQVLYSKLCLETPVYVVDTCWDWYRQYPGSSTAIAYKTNQEVNTRKQFLSWLDIYLKQKKCQDSVILRALRQEMWLLDFPDWLPKHYKIRAYYRWLKKRIIKVKNSSVVSLMLT